MKKKITIIKSVIPSCEHKYTNSESYHTSGIKLKKQLSFL